MIVVILETGVFFLIGYFVLRTYLKRLLYLSHFVCILIAFSISCTVLLEVSFHIFQNDENSSIHNSGLPLILWWTPQIGRKNEIRKCYNRECVISYDRNLWKQSNTKAFAFYGSNIDPMDLPLPKIDAFWALLHEESPKNTPVLLSDDFLKLFDFTSTFSRSSHFPLNALHLDNLNEIRDLRYFVPVVDKNTYVRRGRLSSVLYIQSDCDTFTDRDAYVAELSKHISVDSLGKCLKNAELPLNLRNVSNFYSKDFLRFVAKYKFTIAIENAICDDYVTEKLWRPLIVGSVPIYFGSPTIRDWLPNHESAILISDFNGPLDLSNFLKKINANDKLYELMIAHKLDGTISNQMLKNVMKSRRWKWHSDDNYENFVDEFECQICLHLHGDKSLTNNTDQSHYSCSSPYSILTGEKNESNHWNDILRYEKCQGKAISSFISKNIDYVDADVRKKIDELISEKKC